MRIVKIILLCFLGIIISLIIYFVAATYQNNSTVTSFSRVIGPNGGSIQSEMLFGRLNGVVVEIPPGALTKESTITITLIPKSEFEENGGYLSAEMRYFGGILIHAEDAELLKSISVTLPNSVSATSSDQILVGKNEDIDNSLPMETLFVGSGTVGSPIEFQTASFGSYSVISPVQPYALIRGIFLDRAGNPIPNAVIASSLNPSFITKTDLHGVFTIPAGPAGSSPILMGTKSNNISWNTTSRSSNIGILRINIPNPIPAHPTGLIDYLGGELVRIILDEWDIPEAPVPPPCVCDPYPPTSPIVSVEKGFPPFEMTIGESIHTYVPGYSAPDPNILDAISAFLTGKFCTTSITYSSSSSSIASVNSQGVVSALSEGSASEYSMITLQCVQFCDAYSISCNYPFTAVPAKIRVGCVGKASPTDFYSVTLGKNKTFSSYNLRTYKTSVGPSQKNKPQLLSSYAISNTGRAQVSASAYQEGIAQYTLGLRFSVNPSCSGKKSMTARIQMQVDYSLNVNFNVLAPNRGGGGSADTHLSALMVDTANTLDRINIIHNSNSQSINKTVTLTKTVNLVAGRTYDVSISGYAHTEVYKGTFSDSSNQGTIQSISISFIN